MQLHPAQTMIAIDQHRFRVLVCGRKFGKTTLAAEEIKGCALSKSNKRILYLAPTINDARTLMWDRLNKQLQGAVEKSNDTRLELKVKTQDGGVTDIFLGSWEKIQNYRGDEFDFIVPDETQDYREFWVGWHEALRPTLTPRKGSALFMGTPKGFNHLYDLYNFENRDEDYKSFHFTAYDNPNVDKNEIDKARKELTEDRFAQEYLADFRKTEGLVYKEFNRSKHLFTDEDYKANVITIETIAGIDFGYTNPTAVITIQRDKDNTYWVTDEWYKRGKTDAEVAEYVAGCRFNKVFPDPESPSAIKELINQGVNVREVIKNKDSIKNGIDKVRELFKNNKLKIHNRCENLILELETYSYPEKRVDHNEEENPIKENDHALDALRYALYMSLGSSIERKATIYYPNFLKKYV